MAQNATYNTANRIIQQAMLEASLLEEGQEPTSEQLAQNLNRLNDMINALQTRGIKLWTQVDQTVTLVASQATYTLSPTGDVVMTKPLRVIEAYYVDSNNISRP